MPLCLRQRKHSIPILIFSKVCDFYKEQVFEEVLIQPVLFLLIKFVKLLNTIPPTEVKFKAPFTDSLYNHTENLQRTLRRTLFRNSFSTSRDEQSVHEILTFFQRLESELSNVNLLQKNVTDSYNKALDVYQRFLNVANFKLNS